MISNIKIDDVVITANVRSDLLTAEGVNSTDIRVVTRDGIVRLSGFINSQAQINRVIEVTRGIEGVRGTFNEISIKY
jgi:hyperosmotically inducible protein